MPDIKTIAVFLPFLGACAVGLNYALNQKALGGISLPTYVVIYCTVTIVMMVLIHLFSPLKIDFSPLIKNPATWLIAISIPASMLAWLITLFTVKTISADYTAIAEISYPLFTILFGYLIFARKIDWSMALGASLIISGSFILLYGKLKSGG